MSTESHKETLQFQTEVQQLLKLMIHSLYSNSEIFLREIISNASDAADKLRFEALQNEALYEDEPDLKIRVGYDKEARTITVSDNGIGMSRDEIVDNLGTIAKSGTRQFLEALTGDQSKDAQLIGQFGVGFYSAFIVADKVTVLTRRAGVSGEHGVRWESDGQGSYTVEDIERAERGTSVTLHVREDQDEFLDGFRLRHIIRSYSDHISFPIVMPSENKEKDKDAELSEETVNRASALWMRPKQEITEEEYEEFYKHVAHDFEGPLAYTHNKVEGNVNYTSLLYIPKRAPFDLWDRDHLHGVKLYVRRVFIMDDAEHLLPRYLRFVRGIVDSDDLPLNVSRELLQHNRALDRIRSASVKRILDQLEDMAKNDKEKYAQFWKTFGRVMKEGPGEDSGNLERIAGLLRFSSTYEEKESADVSLAEYTARMKPDQKAIYYVTADSFNGARHSPHLEVFRKKGIEVLLLSDPVDEWMVAHLTEFDGKTLKSVAKGDLDLEGVEGQAEQNPERLQGEFKDLLEKLQTALGEQVREVRLSHRLVDSPSCLVVDTHEFNVGMQRMLKAAGHDLPSGKPVLEINPEHPVILRLKAGEAGGRFEEWAEVLYGQALLVEGGQLDDPTAFVRHVNALLTGMTAEPRS